MFVPNSHPSPRFGPASYCLSRPNLLLGRASPQNVDLDPIPIFFHRTSVHASLVGLNSIERRTWAHILCFDHTGRELIHGQGLLIVSIVFTRQVNHRRRNIKLSGALASVLLPFCQACSRSAPSPSFPRLSPAIPSSGSLCIYRYVSEVTIAKETTQCVAYIVQTVAQAEYF